MYVSSFFNFIYKCNFIDIFDVQKCKDFNILKIPEIIKLNGEILLPTISNLNNTENFIKTMYDKFNITNNTILKTIIILHIIYVLNYKNKIYNKIKNCNDSTIINKFIINDYIDTKYINKYVEINKNINNNIKYYDEYLNLFKEIINI